ncbi:MAG: sigma-70 family RNA polymerase sigma factor [Candidatus Hydrogenedentota bacterium]
MFLHFKELPKEFFRNLNGSKLLSKEQEKELIERIKKGSTDAYEIMVNNNQKLVLSIVRKFCKNEFQINDLMQEGNLGLMRAINKFNERREVKFSTYATWWIRHHVVNAMNYRFSNFRLPVKKLKVLREFNSFMIQFLQKNGRLPDVIELARGLNMSMGTVKKILKLTRGYFQFDVSYGDANNDLIPFEEISNSVRCEENYEPAHNTIKNDLKEKLFEALNLLPLKVKSMLLYRYGFIDGMFHTLKETGKRFNMSAEAIRLYEKKSFDRLRNRCRNLKEYL